MCRAAIDSVIARGFEFGAVDVLQDHAGDIIVAESSFPNYFPRVQNATGDDISGMMIDHLLGKREAILSG